MPQAEKTQTSPDSPAGATVADRRRLPFFMVEWRFLDRFGPVLSPAEICIYLALLRHVDQHGRCWPGQERIGKVAGGQRRETVNRHIRRLVELGLITVESTRNRVVYTIQPLPASPDIRCDENSHHPPDTCEKNAHTADGRCDGNSQGCDGNSQGCDGNSHAGVTETHTNEIHGTRVPEPDGEGTHTPPAAVPPSPPAEKRLGTFLPEAFQPTARSEQVALQLCREWFPQDATPELARRWLRGPDPCGPGSPPGGELAEFTAYWASLPRTARAKKLDWQLTLQNSLRSKPARDRLLMLVLASRRGEGLTKGPGGQRREPSAAAKFYARGYERASRRSPGPGEGGES